jgi:tetratricopeptide (TPR) repeat protein
MSEVSRGSLLERGQAAATRSDWRSAFDLLMEADRDGLLTPVDLPLLSEVAYAAGHLDVTIETWERTHAECLRAGDRLAAAGAAVRVAMHLLFDTALMAPVRGWLTRAERLLEGQPDATPVHAWLAVVRNYERMLTGDVREAREWARRAIEVGSTCDPAAAAIGRVAEARCLILDGDVRKGLALLEEAGVATVSGELDPLSTGVVYCELVCALQGLAQYDLAEEWTEAMERWCQSNAIGSLHGRCRVHRAEILRLRGSCAEAEQEALLACEELRPYLRRELGWPLTELGRIRLQSGDVNGAEESLLEAHDGGWDPQPGLALVHLAQGDAALAAASIRDSLSHPVLVPSKELPPNTDLRRAPLLQAQVEIEIAVGDVDRARSAADELEGIARRFESKALLAGAALAQGRVRLAEGAAAEAIGHLEAAAGLWRDVGAPYEIAVARTELAAAYRANGDEPRAALELGAARRAFEHLGVEPTTSRPAGTETEAGADTAHASSPNVPNPSLFLLEGDFWSVTFEGQTVRVRDVKGMTYLARLLAEPVREFHVLDLVASGSGRAEPARQGTEPGLEHSSGGDSGEMLDARAKESYRRRLTEIDEDLEDARSMGDAEREAQADAERDFLVRELTRAVGLGGRDRRAGSDSERARASVTRAIRQAMVRISDHHRPLGTHLDRAIRTGTYCVYLPDARAPVGWKF